MANFVIADTDVVIDFFTDTAPFAKAVADLIKEESLAVTAITVFELFAGVVGAKRLEQLEAFCERVPIFTLGLIEATYAAKIYTDLKSKGAAVGNQDILIAGICIANGLPFLTRNRAHFAPVQGLVLF